MTDAVAAHVEVHAPLAGQSTFQTMDGVIGEALAFGPTYMADATGAIITAPGVYVEPLSVEVVDADALDVVVTVVPDTFSRSFTDVANDTGAGQLAYANTDTDASAELLTGRLVNFLVYGVRAFSILVESLARTRWTDGEEHDQVTVVVGRGNLAYTEEAVLYPSRGADIQPIEEDRTFNWSTPSPVYDHSGWGYAKVIMTVAEAQTDWQVLPFAEGWPDDTTGVIWASTGYQDTAPVGTCYFRQDFTVSATGWYLVYAACDNRGSLWLDGQKVIDIGGFTGLFSYLVYITAGDHTFAAECENVSQPPPMAPTETNPAGLVVAVYTSNEAGAPDTLLFHTDGSWRIVEYPPYPPGMLVGKVMRIVVEEAQARGAIPELLLDFTDTTDSNGLPWDETTDIATKVGTSLLVFLRELTATYVDLWMQPGTLTLSAFVKGTRARARSVDLHGPTDDADPATGNVYELGATVLA